MGRAAKKMATHAGVGVRASERTVKNVAQEVVEDDCSLHAVSPEPQRGWKGSEEAKIASSSHDACSHTSHMRTARMPQHHIDLGRTAPFQTHLDETDPTP